MKSRFKKLLSLLMCFALVFVFVNTCFALKEVKVTSVSLNVDRLSLDLGKTYKVKVVFAPLNTTQKQLIFSTSNSQIVSVDKDGNLVAKATGVATIKVVSKYNSSLKDSSIVTVTRQKPTKLVYFRTTGSPPAEWELKATHDYILNASNYDIRWITAAQGTEAEKIALMMAAREQLDLVERDIYNFRAKKWIQPVGKYLKSYGQNILGNQDVPKEFWDIMTDKDGEIWGMPRVTPIVGTPVFFRKDWLDMVGMVVPSTIAEYDTYLQKVKDLDPAGNKKTIPMAFTNWYYLEQSLAAGFTGAPIESGPGGAYMKDKQGNFKYAATYPGYDDFIAKVAEWYKKGYLYKESFLLNLTTFRNLVATGTVASAPTWISAITLSEFYNTIYKEDNQKDYTWNSRGIKGPKGLCETAPGFNAYGYVVPVHSKKAADVVKYMNWIYSDINNFAITMGLKLGENAKWGDKSKGIVQLTNGKTPGDYKLPYMVPSYVLEMKLLTADTQGNVRMHEQKAYIEGLLFQYNRAVKNESWKKVPDFAEVNKNFPQSADISTYFNQNIQKFIMGVRPMSEYNDFVKELKKLGLDELENAVTNVYKKS